MHEPPEEVYVEEEGRGGEPPGSHPTEGKRWELQEARD